MKTMHRINGRAIMKEELMPQEGYQKSLIAFCQNRRYMTPEESREIIEHLKLMRATAMIVGIRTQGEN